jgi:hypothetical protein
MEGANTQPADPVFVGGSPRSGTHIVAHLVAHHSGYAMIPKEVAFHCAPRFVPAYVRGSISAAELVDRLRTMWSDTTFTGRGLRDVVSRPDLDAAVSTFVGRSSDGDRAAAANTLVRGLFDPFAKRHGESSWSEKSLLNVASAPLLQSVFPSAQVIHMVRDGRDAACSVAPLPYGRNSVPDALRQWALRLRAADEGMRNASRPVLVLHLEDLILMKREESYQRLLRFLGLADEPVMRSFFDAEMSPERAHIGRWRAELAGTERSEIEALYAELLRELSDAGVSTLPLDAPASVSFGRRDDEEPNPFDPWADFRSPNPGSA